MGKYDDIINLMTPISKTHKQMSANDRAAQFLPFAALTGYDAAILEAARKTAEKHILSNEDRLAINEKLNILKAHEKDNLQIGITYFIKDKNKDGGRYSTEDKIIKKIDDFSKNIIFTDGSIVSFNDIYSISSSIIDDNQYIF